MPSSVIRRFAYCPDSDNLWVEFTTGRRYVYSDVPREVADTFRSRFRERRLFQHPHPRSLSASRGKPRAHQQPGNAFLKLRRDNRRMIPMRNSTIFKSRWMALAVGGRDHLVRL